MLDYVFRLGVVTSDNYNKFKQCFYDFTIYFLSVGIIKFND